MPNFIHVCLAWALVQWLEVRPGVSTSSGQALPLASSWGQDAGLLAGLRNWTPLGELCLPALEGVQPCQPLKSISCSQWNSYIEFQQRPKVE